MHLEEVPDCNAALLEHSFNPSFYMDASGSVACIESKFKAVLFQS